MVIGADTQLSSGIMATVGAVISPLNPETKKTPPDRPGEASLQDPLLESKGKGLRTEWGFLSCFFFIWFGWRHG